MAKTVEADRYCAYTDADNDQIFEKCDLTSALVKSTYEGAQLLVGYKNGTYKIVKTN